MSGWVLKSCLNVLGAYIFATPDDDVFYSSGNPDIAEFILACLVPCSEKTILCKNVLILLSGT